MLVIDAAGGLEEGLTHGVFLHEVAHEFAGLDVGQHGLHAGLRLIIGQDARARDVFAVFGGVRDGVVHVRDAAFVDQVDDQLHLVQAFEIGHLGLVSRFDQGFEAHADQLYQATAEDGLFAEEIGFAFLTEVGFDDARAAAADGGAVGEADLHRLAGRVLVDGDEAGDAAALGVFAADSVAGALGGHHDDVDAGLGFDQAEMDVEAVGKGDGGAFAEVVMDVLAVGGGLQFVGHGEHDEVAPGGGFGDAHDLEALGFGLFGGGGTRTEGDDEVLGARIAEVEGVGVALGAVAEDGDLLVLDEVHVAVTIVIDAHCGDPFC